MALVVEPRLQAKMGLVRCIKLHARFPSRRSTHAVGRWPRHRPHPDRRSHRC